MATSGITGQTIFTTQQVIDHAFRRAKVPPEVISGEDVDTAFESLWLFLQAWANRGAPVWKIETHLFPMYQGQPQVPVGVDVVKVMNANFRTLTRLGVTADSDQGGIPSYAIDGDLETACTQTGADGSITLDFGTDTTLTTIGLLPNVSGTWSYVYEISQDGATWVNVATFTAQAVVAREWAWVDYQITRYAYYRYARIRATGGTTLDIIEFYVGNGPSAIPMAPLNKDDYFRLPNKSFQSNRIVQFWQNFDRTQPELMLWPVPNWSASLGQIEAQVQAKIQDVGTMVQELDLTALWFEAVVATLAEKVCDTHPEAKADPDRLERKAATAQAEAWAGVIPSGPMYLQPNISPYTRG